MKTRAGIALGLFLVLVPSHGPDGGWASACCAAVSPLAPLESAFSGRGADQVSPVEIFLEPQAPLAATVQGQIRREDAGEDERGVHAFEVALPLPVSASNADESDRVLTPAASIGLARNPPAFQFPMPPISHGPASIGPQR